MSLKHRKSYTFYKKNENNGIRRILLLLPILLTVGLLPLMVRLYIYDVGLTEFDWYYYVTDTNVGDSYLFYRQWWFTGIAIYMTLVLLILFIRDRKSIRFCISALPMGIYAFMAFLSSLFSDYKKFSFGGIYEQFENVFVLMGYALIVYYTFIVVNKEEDIKLILYTLTASTIILGLIGTFQTFFIDFFSTKLGMLYAVPQNIPFSVEAKQPRGVAYMTLYNPNYVGVYVTMLLPLFITLLVFTKKWQEGIAYLTTSILLIISLYGSGSKAGFLVIAFVLLFLVAFLRRQILSRWHIVIPVITGIICVFLTINNYYDNAYINRIINALRISTKEYSLQEITTQDNGIHIVYNDNSLNVSMEHNEENLSFHFLDENGSQVKAQMGTDNNTFILTDDRFDGFEVCPVLLDEDLFGFYIQIEGRKWYFSNEYSEDGSYYYLTDKKKFDRMIKAEQVIFNNYENLFSGRGYIWSVTIPLLKKYFFLGSGADTFMISFPQQDYLRLWRNGYADLVMSKPHSLYLQVGVQTGVISLLALVAFFIIYGVSSIRLYFNCKYENFYERVGVAVFLSVVGFAVMGISNDSSTAVSPIFWAIAGLGLALNMKNKELRKVSTL